MHKKILLGVLAAATLALAVPSMASATLGTPVPNLPSGVDQAYLADGLGNAENGTVTLTGNLNLVGAVTINCDNHVVIDYFDDGTTAVTDFTTSNCMVAAPLTDRCNATVTATNLDWGDRFGYNTSQGVYRDYVNVHFDVTLTNGAGGPCPVTGTFSETGTLSPALSISGDVISANFDSGSGSVSSPLGTATVNGTLTGTLPTDDTQLIHD